MNTGKTIDTDKLIERLENMGPAISEYAKAKSERKYIEQYRKSLKALLMKQSKGTTVSERENDAYSHQEYLDLLAGLKASIEVETKNEWALERLKIEFEMWRTLSANDRYVKDRV